MTIYRDQLQAVYKLIEKPEHWTQNEYAKDVDGNAARARSDDAVCWCMWGAVEKAITPWHADAEVTNAFGFEFSYQVNDFNDTHTHAEVLALLRSAIERAPVRP